MGRLPASPFLTAGAAIVALLSGCAPARQSLIDREFADVARNCKLPQARMVPDPRRQKLLVLQGVEMIDREADSRGHYEQGRKIRCIRAWARKNKLLVSTRGFSSGPPQNLCAEGFEPDLPTSFGAQGLRANYSFVTEGALRAELTTFLAKAKARRFGIYLITVNINGYDTVFVPGRSALRSIESARLERKAVCELQTGPRIYLVHARYNDAADPAEQGRVH